MEANLINPKCSYCQKVISDGDNFSAMNEFSVKYFISRIGYDGKIACSRKSFFFRDCKGKLEQEMVEIFNCYICQDNFLKKDQGNINCCKWCTIRILYPKKFICKYCELSELVFYGSVEENVCQTCFKELTKQRARERIKKVVKNEEN